MGLAMRLSTPELRSSDAIEGVCSFLLLTFRLINEDTGVRHDWLLFNRVENVKRGLLESFFGTSLKEWMLFCWKFSKFLLLDNLFVVIQSIDFHQNEIQLQKLIDSYQLVMKCSFLKILIEIKHYFLLSIVELFHVLLLVNVHFVQHLIDEHNQQNLRFVIQLIPVHFLHPMVDYQMDYLHHTNTKQLFISSRFWYSHLIL
jgi:hypothetical protein